LAVDGVGTGPAGYEVRASAALQGVVAGSAEECVVAAGSPQRVVAAVAANLVIT